MYYSSAVNLSRELAEKEAKKRERAKSLKLSASKNNLAADDASTVSSQSGSQQRSSSYNDLALAAAGGDISTPRPTEAWLVKKNALLRAETLKAIREDLAVEKTRFTTLRAKCLASAEVAMVRHESGNTPGAVISLKKIRPAAVELRRCIFVLTKLSDLAVSISDCDSPPESFHKFIAKVVETHHTLQERDEAGIEELREKEVAESNREKISITTTEVDLRSHMDRGTLVSHFESISLDKVLFDEEKIPAFDDLHISELAIATADTSATLETTV